MRVFIGTLLSLIAAPAFADNIANCEIVLMEAIAQEGLEGKAEVASFRPADDFMESIYDDDIPIIREIDGLPIRAVMSQRPSPEPSVRDFPIVASGIPFMISQNFDSPDTGLTTIFFKNGKFQHSYKGSELNADIQAELDYRIEVYNFQPHELTEKEAAMKAKESAPAPEVEVEEVEEVEAEEVEETLEDTFEVTTADILPSTDEWVDVLPEETSTEILPWVDDILAESTNQEGLDLE